MALTSADLERLETALATGETKVMYDGRMIEIASADDLIKRIAYVKSQLAAASKPSQSFASFSRG